MMQVESYPNTAPCVCSNAERKRPQAWLLCRKIALVLLLNAGLAWTPQAAAQLLDRIEVEASPRGGKEIIVHFLRDLAVLRVSPSSAGQTLRIYVQFLSEGDTARMRERLRSGSRHGLPPFEVTYPELDGSVSVAFAAPVQFRVSQVRGARTVSIMIPDTP
jgi:hypothetical protein